MIMALRAWPSSSAACGRNAARACLHGRKASGGRRSGATIRRWKVDGYRAPDAGIAPRGDLFIFSFCLFVFGSFKTDFVFRSESKRRKARQ